MKWSNYFILFGTICLTMYCNRKIISNNTNTKSTDTTEIVDTIIAAPIVTSTIPVAEPPVSLTTKGVVTKTFPIRMDQVPIYNYAQLEPFLSKQNNDTTYVVNFWATWCRPCVEELPYFEELHHYANGKPLKVMLVSLDFKHQFESKLIPFINEHKIESDVVVLSDPNSNNWINRISDTWSGALPGTLIYDNKNRMFLEMAFEDFTQIKNIVEKFNRE